MLTFFGDTKFQLQKTEEHTRLCNKVTHLGRKTKTHAAEGRVTVLLDSLVVAHKLQPSYTPCGKFSHSVTPSLIYLRLLKEAGKVIPNSPCIHHTYIYPGILLAYCNVSREGEASYNTI